MNRCSPQESGDTYSKNEVLEQIIAKRSDELFAIGYFYCEDRELAEEAVQESYARFLASNAIIKDPFKWLATAASNYVRDVRRRKRYVANAMDNDTIAELSTHRANTHWESTVEQEKREDAHILKTLIQELSPEERGIFLMRAALGWPSKRIGSILGIRDTNVNMRLTRTRQKLREAYEKSMQPNHTSS